MSVVESRVENHLGRIIINRPDKLNALNNEVLEKLESSVLDFQQNTSVGVIVIQGAGEKSFVAGADIAELSRLTAEQARIQSLRGQSVFNLIEQSSKPIIASIQGFALGGGCELALACHIRIASESARLALPEVSLGLIPGYGGTQRLARLVGMGVALDMILSGEMISASDAYRIGLVSRVYPASELNTQTDKLAETILSRGPNAVSLALKSVRDGLHLSLAKGLEHEASLFGLIAESNEAQEGTAAFLEKRKPNFHRS
jgi:enoyl-CoA hydratase